MADTNPEIPGGGQSASLQGEVPEIILAFDPNDVLRVLTGMRPDGTADTFPLEEKYLNKLLEEREPDRKKARTTGTEMGGAMPEMDERSSIWKNLVENYAKAAKNPLRTGVYGVSRKAVRKLRDLLRDGNKEKIREFLKEFEIRPREAAQTNKNQKAMADNQQAPATGQDGQKPSKYNLSMIDPKHLELFGLSVEMLQRMGHMDNILRGGKTNDVIPVTMEVGGVKVQAYAKLSLRPTAEGPVKLHLNCVKEKPDFVRPMFGHTPSPDDTRNLIDGPNMGRLVTLKIDGETVPGFISRDMKTNEVFRCKQSDVTIRDEYFGVKLDDFEKEQLFDGKAIKPEGMTTKDGRELNNVYLQVSAESRRVEPVFTQRTERVQSLGGVELSGQQREDYDTYKMIKVEGMKGQKEGELYDRFVMKDRFTQRPVYYRANPETGEVITPAVLSNVDIPKEDQIALGKGETIFVKDMEFQNGDVGSRFVKLDMMTGIPMYATAPDGFVQVPQYEVPPKIWNATPTGEQRAALQNGDSIFLEGQKRADGQTISGWVTFDARRNQTVSHDSDPYAERKAAQGQNTAGEQKKEQKQTRKQDENPNKKQGRKRFGL